LGRGGERLTGGAGRGERLTGGAGGGERSTGGAGGARAQRPKVMPPARLPGVDEALQMRGKQEACYRGAGGGARVSRARHMRRCACRQSLPPPLPLLTCPLGARVRPEPPPASAAAPGLLQPTRTWTAGVPSLPLLGTAVRGHGDATSMSPACRAAPRARPGSTGMAAALCASAAARAGVTAVLGPR
jgi:hypothetical protein